MAEVYQLIEDNGTYEGFSTFSDTRYTNAPRGILRWMGQTTIPLQAAADATSLEIRLHFPTSFAYLVSDYRVAVLSASTTNDFNTSAAVFLVNAFGDTPNNLTGDIPLSTDFVHAANYFVGPTVSAIQLNKTYNFEPVKPMVRSRPGATPYIQIQLSNRGSGENPAMECYHFGSAFVYDVDQANHTEVQTPQSVLQR
jgi:hypothetical protein